MPILSIETATPHCSVALWLEGQVYFEEDLTPHSHTKKVLPMVDRLLKQHGLDIQHLDAIAFDAGPGSFTGLRIGAGITQGLSLAHQIPTVAVSSLHAMAEQVHAPAMAIALDARMEEVYFTRYHAQTFDEPAVGKIADITLDPAIDWTLVGNGWEVYGVPEAYQQYPQQTAVLPHAKEIALLASQQLPRLPTHQAQPHYVRNV